MSFSVNISWPAQDSAANLTSTDHELSFGSGQYLQGSAAAEYRGNDTRVNPEESLLSALAACHMLSFLTIVQKKRLTLMSYHDQASAELGTNAQGRTAITRITLNPKVESVPPLNDEQLTKLHALAHKHCFIANSLAKEIAIEIITG
ncbi:OsmC family protein [Shewanella sp. Isolate7]|uniref:OsmC family protein n=1 Tax=Shewanella sp. Isolate7 TaxID=2908528 RepID=UPI001EFD2506|nr:OsmC family protein [Shewanella sp. Isolate7]